MADVSIQIGERTLHGEVLPRIDAEQAYQQADASGQQAGLATQESFQNFRFNVAWFERQP